MSTPPYLRDARSKGIPSLGAGAIYPIPDDQIICSPFAIPPHWFRAYGMDVGWRNTAAVWLAEDPDTQVLYAHAEHKRGETIPIVHAEAIKARGAWIPGAIDPASRGRSQDDGDQLFIQYRELGLEITPADNSVEAGIYMVWQALELGRLKIFSTCQGLLTEKRLYRRDEKGKIVKENDHLLDALRYGLVRFRAIARQRPAIQTVGTYSAPDATAGY